MLKVCPACDIKENYETMRQIDDFIIFRCKNCNAVYSNVQDDKIRSREIGPKQSIKFYEIPRFWINRRLFYTTAIWDVSYLTSKLDLSTIKTCLDIGAQYGFLVRELTKKGINTTGIDVAIYPGTVTENITYCFFDASFEETRKYDLICLTNMIYYFSDSYSILDKCLRMLNDNGILFITSYSPESTLIQDFVMRKDYAPLLYLSKQNYVQYCKKNNLTLLDYSTFCSKLFPTKLDLRDKLETLFRFILYEFGMNKSFVADSDGERSYLLIRKN